MEYVPYIMTLTVLWLAGLLWATKPAKAVLRKLPSRKKVK